MRPKSIAATVEVGAKAEHIRAFDGSYSGATSAGPFSVVIALVALWAAIKLAAGAGTSSKITYGSTVDAAYVPRLIKKDDESVYTIKDKRVRSLRDIHRLLLVGCCACLNWPAEKANDNFLNCPYATSEFGDELLDPRASLSYSFPIHQIDGSNNFQSVICRNLSATQVHASQLGLRYMLLDREILDKLT